MIPSRILVVEDEPALLRFLVPVLEGQGHQAIQALSAAEGIHLSRSHNPDVMLLDLGLPDRDGLAVLRDFRSWSARPVIILSARTQEADKVRALDAGADDYLTKPFGAAELLARVRVALRHSARDPQGESVFVCGGLKVDTGRRDVTLDGVPVRLTPLEYRLLEALVHRAGKVATQAQLLAEVWGPGSLGQGHYLRIYMAQLRRKLEAEPARPRYFLTEPGVGYRLSVE